MTTIPIKRALLSVSDKNGLADLGSKLAKAKELGIPVLDQAGLLQLLKGN